MLTFKLFRDLKAENLMLNSGNILKIIGELDFADLLLISLTFCKDFGLSNDMTGKDFLDTQCGSMVRIKFMFSPQFFRLKYVKQSYSAPELLSHKPYGKAVDVWSMYVTTNFVIVLCLIQIFRGVCLYVLLTGRLPFGNMATLTELHVLHVSRSHSKLNCIVNRHSCWMEHILFLMPCLSKLICFKKCYWIILSMWQALEGLIRQNFSY